MTSRGMDEQSVCPDQTFYNFGTLKSLNQRLFFVQTIRRPTEFVALKLWSI